MAAKDALHAPRATLAATISQRSARAASKDAFGRGTPSFFERNHFLNEVDSNLNHRIRRIKDGVVTTVAGTGLELCPPGTAENVGCHVDGPVDQASLMAPLGIAVADDGTLYVAESRGHIISRISDGVVEAIAGTGEEGVLDGAGDEAQFALPSYLGLLNDGSLVVVDRGNQKIRKILLGP